MQIVTSSCGVETRTAAGVKPPSRKRRRWGRRGLGDRPRRTRPASICLSLLSVALSTALAAPPANATIEAPKILPAEVIGNNAVLHALLNPKAPAGEEGIYQFKLGHGSTCEEDSRVGPEVPFAGTKAGEAATVSVEILPGQIYTVCAVANNTQFTEFFPSELGSFKTPATAPSIEQTQLFSKTPTYVRVGANIGAGGATTQYQLELVAQPEFEREGWTHAGTYPPSPSTLPARSEPTSVYVTAPVQPATAYDARFIAWNGIPLPGARTQGPTIQFETPPQISQQLPDHRAYELVTPPPSGEPYMPGIPIGSLDAGAFESSLPIQAAANGEALAYVGEAPNQGGVNFVGNSRGNNWISVRNPTGWQPAAIQPEGEESVYQAFNQDLTEGFMEGGLPRVPEECRSLYSSRIGSQPVMFSPLFAGTKCGLPLYAGSSANGTVLIQDEAALTAYALPSSSASTTWFVGNACTEGCNLYEASGGNLTPINELNGQPVPSANFGGTAGGNPPDFSHVISADGSRIFWTDTQAGEDFGRVFVRENKSKSIPVSLGTAEYVAATVDGRFAYYIEAGVLWRFDTDTSQRSLVTPETYPAGGQVLGVLGINEEGEDGAYVYYVDGSVLAEGHNGHGESAQLGQPNLYVDHDGQVIYIATLSSEDNELEIGHEGEHGGDWQANLGLRTAELTPDGENLIFESKRSLTGYNNVVSGVPIPEVFHYDASTRALACASCAPSGLPPEPNASGEGGETRLPVSWLSDVHQKRWMSSDGSRVFFDSTAALVSAATSPQQNVYEWESEGTNECPTLSHPLANSGCVYLLSSGSSPHIATFVEADATGNNAFFEQRGSLGSVSVVSGADEIYDARVNGGIPSPIPECSHGNCNPPVQAPAQAPSLGFATSEGAGLGNFGPQPSAPARKPASKPNRQQLLAKALKHCQHVRRGSARLRCRRSATKRFGGRRR